MSSLRLENVGEVSNEIDKIQASISRIQRKLTQIITPYLELQESLDGVSQAIVELMRVYDQHITNLKNENKRLQEELDAQKKNQQWGDEMVSTLEIVTQLKKIRLNQESNGIIIKGKDGSGNLVPLKVADDGSLLVKTE